MPIKQPHIGFVTGIAGWWRNQRLVAKYFKMRLEGLVYPDVYSIPYSFADKFDFLPNDAKVKPGHYDLLFSELQGSHSQLAYLDSLVAAGSPPLAVIPGPPEILSRDLTHEKLLMMRRILNGARYVWAYSEAVRRFCDGLIGKRRAVLIPWPFDFEATRRLARRNVVSEGNRHKILLQVPLRFAGITQNHPFVLKGVLMDVWQDLPDAVKERITFHTFVYSGEDREQYFTLKFPEGLPIKLEPKRNYASFVRFVSECDGVINLTVGQILGRVTFIAAALGKRGVFSGNSDINRSLYPNSIAESLDTVRIRDLFQALLMSFAIEPGDQRLLPDAMAVAIVGDYVANAAKMRSLIADLYPCVALRAS